MNRSHIVITILAIACAFDVTNARAQSQKIPTEYWNAPSAPRPDYRIKSASVLQSVALTFTNNDTSLLANEINFLKYDVNGQLSECRSHKFPLPVLNRFDSSIADCGHIIQYEYDTRGNLTTAKHILLSITGSNNNLNGQVFVKENKSNVHLLVNCPLTRFVDSVVNSNLMSYRTTHIDSYAYDSDGNVILYADRAHDTIITYKYEHDEKGRVDNVLKIVKGFTNKTPNIWEHSFFTYNSIGLLDSIIYYNNTPVLTIHYNEEGRVHILDRYHYGESQYQTREIIAYKNKLPTAKTYFFNNKSDTSIREVYVYENDCLTSTLTTAYDDPQKTYANERIAYNSRRLPIEVATTYKDFASNYLPITTRQTIYFYGDRHEDQQTAERVRKLKSIAEAQNNAVLKWKASRIGLTPAPATIPHKK